jgi:hypothetical protein
MIVGVPLELPHVTAIGEVELPEVGVHEGVAAAPPPVIVNSPLLTLLGSCEAVAVVVVVTVAGLLGQVAVPFVQVAVDGGPEMLLAPWQNVPGLVTTALLNAPLASVTVAVDPTQS